MPQDSVEIPLDELPPGSVRRVRIDDQPVCVAHTPDGVFAVSDSCTHARIPLSEGYVEGRQIVCPWHGAMFDLKTGRATCGPAVDPLRCYRARIDGSFIVVDSSVSPS